MIYKNLIYHELNESLKILKNFITKNIYIKNIEDAATLIVNTFKNGGKIISCGNGGSCCDAMHFSEELTCRYKKNRIGYPAITISDPSYISCVSNDFGYDQIFSRFIQSIGNKNDILFSISTSGKSENIINAINTAYKKDMHIIILTGQNGIFFPFKNTKKIEIRVTETKETSRIQEMHIKIIHILILLIEKKMNKL